MGEVKTQADVLRFAPGRHSAGQNLYLQVTSAGARSWLFRFMLNSKQRDMGLGSAAEINLSEARDLATDARRLCARGIDPIEHRKQQIAERQAKTRKVRTFRQCAQDYIALNSPSWRNPKHAQQWPNTLEAYVYPVMGNLPVDKVDTEHVLKVLRPLWTDKVDTAKRVRGRIEIVLNAATAADDRPRGQFNPATWRGHLDQLLPKPSKVRKVKHHPALPYADVPEFMRRLRAIQTRSARALEFTILTAARTNEAIEGRRFEINFEAAIWSRPAERMKANEPHRVPLSSRAVEILRESLSEESEFLFAGRSDGLSENTMLKTLKGVAFDMFGHAGFTVHGCRSSFRDWAAECTEVPNHVVEMALAHAIENETEAAYRRGDLFEKRRKLMDAWADYCGSGANGDNVVPLSKAG